MKGVGDLFVDNQIRENAVSRRVWGKLDAGGVRKLIAVGKLSRLQDGQSIRLLGKKELVFCPINWDAKESVSFTQNFHGKFVA